MTTYHVVGLDDWQFLDSIVAYLKKFHDAKTIMKEDGLVARKWQYQCGGELFWLEHHDDLGNWFHGDASASSDALMERIAKILEERLANIPFE